MSEDRKATELVSEITLEEFQKAYRMMKPLGSKVIGTFLGVVFVLLGGYLALGKWESGVKAMIPGLLVAAAAVFYLVYDHYLFYRSSVKKKYQQICKAEGTDRLVRIMIPGEDTFRYGPAGKPETYRYDQVDKKYRFGNMELWICGNQMIFKKE